MDAVAWSEVARNWAIVLGGGLGLALAFWRGLAASRQALASREQARLQRRDHATELFNRAVEQLADDRLEVRLSAIYTLRAVIVDFADFSLPVTEVLQAFLAERTAERSEETLGPDLAVIVEILLDASDQAATGRQSQV